MGIKDKIVECDCAFCRNIRQPFKVPKGLLPKIKEKAKRFVDYCDAGARNDFSGEKLLSMIRAIHYEEAP